MGFYPVGSGTTIRHNTQHTLHKVTHHAQTNHSTQNYTNNKGHTTHSAYNTNIITTTINSMFIISLLAVPRSCKRMNRIFLLSNFSHQCISEEHCYSIAPEFSWRKLRSTIKHFECKW
jgi:hypothetical protein